MAYLELNDVTFAYPNGFTAIEHVSMSFELGEAVAIIGQNGAGKTTTVKLMNGLLKPTQGTVTVDGEPTEGRSTASIAAKVGYVFQNPNDQIFQDSVRKEIAYGLVKRAGRNADRAAIDAKVRDAAEWCGLTDELDTHPYDLPFSMRKFVTIAATMVMDPQVLILDEPTAGQDRSGTERLGRLIEHVRGQGRTVITITHDMEFVAREFKRGIVMANKHMLMDAPVADIFWNDEVLAQANLQRPYIAQLAETRGLRGVLTIDDLLARDAQAFAGAPDASVPSAAEA